MYGSYEDQRNLRRFYSRAGFVVHPAGHPVDMWVVTGVQGGPGTDPGEIMFSQNLQR